MVDSVLFSHLPIDDVHQHESYNAAVDMDGNRAAGLEGATEADCILILESRISDYVALIAGAQDRPLFDDDEFEELMTSPLCLGLLKANAHPRHSVLITNEPAEHASVELLESLWEDDDGHCKRPNNECELRRVESKFDRSYYRRWIGAKGLHTR